MINLHFGTRLFHRQPVTSFSEKYTVNIAQENRSKYWINVYLLPGQQYRFKGKSDRHTSSDEPGNRDAEKLGYKGQQNAQKKLQGTKTAERQGVNSIEQTC